MPNTQYHLIEQCSIRIVKHSHTVFHHVHEHIPHHVTISIELIFAQSPHHRWVIGSDGGQPDGDFLTIITGNFNRLGRNFHTIVGNGLNQSRVVAEFFLKIDGPLLNVGPFILQ